MGFTYEQIAIDGDIEKTPEHVYAVKKHRGLPLGSRVIDRKTQTILYCLQIGGDLGRPPGKYILFFNGVALDIRAHMYDRVNRKGQLTTYFRIYPFEIPEDIQSKSKEVMENLESAINIEARSFPTVPFHVKIEYAKD